MVRGNATAIRIEVTYPIFSHSVQSFVVEENWKPMEIYGAFIHYIWSTPSVWHFFSNLHALLKVLCIISVMMIENWCLKIDENLKVYKNTLTHQNSSNLALLNVNFDVKHDLDLIIEANFNSVQPRFRWFRNYWKYLNETLKLDFLFYVIYVEKFVMYICSQLITKYHDL